LKLYEEKKCKIDLAYAQYMDDYSKQGVRTSFHERISENAKIETNGFTSYAPSGKEFI